MKAYVIESAGVLRVEERPRPTISGDEVLVRVTHVGICGSDNHFFAGTYKGPSRYPILFGHEWAGIVEEMSGAAGELAVGDTVTGDCSRYCGACANCLVDKNVCQSIEKFGITVDGASAEVIARAARYLYKVPGDLDRSLVCLAEPLAVSANLVGRIAGLVGDLSRKKVLVFGGGAIGIGALAILLRRHRCCHVEVAEPSAFRSSVAREFGAGVPPADVLGTDADTQDYHALYAEGIYDIVLETSGSPEAFRRALHVVRPRGVIGCLGMAPEVRLEQKLIVLKALTVMGSIGGTGMFPTVIDFIRNNQVLVRGMISQRLPIARAAEAFALSRDTERSVKIVLELDG